MVIRIHLRNGEAFNVEWEGAIFPITDHERRIYKDTMPDLFRVLNDAARMGNSFIGINGSIYPMSDIKVIKPISGTPLENGRVFSPIGKVIIL